MIRKARANVALRTVATRSEPDFVPARQRTSARSRWCAAAPRASAQRSRRCGAPKMTWRSMRWRPRRRADVACERCPGVRRYFTTSESHRVSSPRRPSRSRKSKSSLRPIATSYPVSSRAALRRTRTPLGGGMTRRVRSASPVSGEGMSSPDRRTTGRSCTVFHVPISSGWPRSSIASKRPSTATVFEFTAPCKVASAVGSNKSSPSRKRTHSPRAASSPALRATAGPPDSVRCRTRTR